MKELFHVLGNHLQAKRLKVGLSQGEVAKRLGYGSPQFISNVERGLCTFPLEKLRQILPLYEISGESLLNLMLAEQEKFLRKELGLKKQKR